MKNLKKYSFFTIGVFFLILLIILILKTKELSKTEEIVINKNILTEEENLKNLEFKNELDRHYKTILAKAIKDKDPKICNELPETVESYKRDAEGEIIYIKSRSIFYPQTTTTETTNNLWPQGTFATPAKQCQMATAIYWLDLKFCPINNEIACLFEIAQEMKAQKNDGFTKICEKIITATKNPSATYYIKECYNTSNLESEKIKYIDNIYWNDVNY